MSLYGLAQVEGRSSLICHNYGKDMDVIFPFRLFTTMYSFTATTHTAGWSPSLGTRSGGALRFKGVQRPPVSSQ
jgi:hypothetical protein